MYDGPSVKEKINLNIFSLPLIADRKYFLNLFSLPFIGLYDFIEISRPFLADVSINGLSRDIPYFQCFSKILTLFKLVL